MKMKKFDYFIVRMILFENIPSVKPFTVYCPYIYSTIYSIPLDFGYMWNGQIFIILLNLGTLVYGGHLVMKDRLSISHFISFVLYQQRLGDLLDVK